VIIPEGAHHLDLMFSNADDPPSVVHARQVATAAVAAYISAATHRPAVHDSMQRQLAAATL
jgi:lysosomal Pro-X carboxypeptidase